MEIKSTIHIVNKLVHFACKVFVCLLVMQYCATAQSSSNKLYVKDAKMCIELSKQINDGALDSFITRYDFSDLELKKFIKSGFPDSLKKRGWKIEINNAQHFVLCKVLEGFDDINKPADRILFTEKKPSFDQLFPVVSSGVVYGYNRFKNKQPFACKDSMVTFYLRNNTNARKVMLAGSFNNWEPDALAMIKTDSGWIANVKLVPGKYWYKFIVDGNWTIDHDNILQENDGLGNTNSIFFKPNHTFRLNPTNNARKVYVAGSFNEWRTRELLMKETASGWELPLYLADGTHTYRFIADGKWMTDPGNSQRLPNEFNDFNSVIRIGKPRLFFLEGYPDARQVVLSGSFNNWRKDELYMTKTAAGWELPYTLGPGNYQYRFIVDNKWVSQVGAVDNGGNSYFVIDPNYTFRLKGFDNAKNIFLAGDFNNWSPNIFLMEKKGQEWMLKIHLSPGKHLYKFVVDGKWILDPGNKLWEQNGQDTGNSIIWIEMNPEM